MHEAFIAPLYVALYTLALLLEVRPSRGGLPEVLGSGDDPGIGRRGKPMGGGSSFGQSDGEPHKGLFSNFFRDERFLYFLTALICLWWYCNALNDIKRECRTALLRGLTVRTDARQFR